MGIRLAAADDLPALFAYLGEQLAENGRGGVLFQPMEPT
ncbi:MAG: GNAT family N-acetyltransferase, partial [Lysobacteraceae bacterium]